MWVASMAAAAGAVWDAVYTDEQAKRGQAVYLQECATCHGPDLEGADVAPSLAGAEFMTAWNDLTVGDLFERIRTTMPQDRPGALTRQQNADVIAFMLQVNKWPAGTTELPRELEPLKAIKILATKP